MMHASPPPIRVAVNDRQLHVVAVMDHGRVLVPLRAIVDALHADLRQIRLPLPPPSRIIAGRTYAPVRAIATLLHAKVEYDGRSRIVSVYGRARVAAWLAPHASSSPVAVAVSGEEPADGARVGSAYPTIAANLHLQNGATIASLRVVVDGIDVGPYASYDGTFVTYIPRDGLRRGMHTVSISGSTTSAAPFSTAWSFETTQAPAPNSADYSAGDGFSPLQLLVSGYQVVGGAPIAVQLLAPPGGRAYAFVCTSAWQYELYAAPSSNDYWGSVPTDRVNGAITCPITAMYVAWNGAVTYAPYPRFVQLLPLQTPQPQPTPTPAPLYHRIPGPSPIRRTPPSAAPTTTAPVAPILIPLPVRSTPVPRRIPVRPIVTPRITPAPHHISLPVRSRETSSPKTKPKPTPKKTPPAM